MSHEVEGPHASVGGELARRYERVRGGRARDGVPPQRGRAADGGGRDRADRGLAVRRAAGGARRVAGALRHPPARPRGGRHPARGRGEGLRHARRARDPGDRASRGSSTTTRPRCSRTRSPATSSASSSTRVRSRSRSSARAEPPTSPSEARHRPGQPRLPQAPERVFEYVLPVDLSTVIKRWGPLPGVKGTRDQSGTWDHVGATRTVLLEDGSSGKEELTAYNPPHHFGYTLTLRRRPPASWPPRPPAPGGSTPPTTAAPSSSGPGPRHRGPGMGVVHRGRAGAAVGALRRPGARRAIGVASWPLAAQQALELLEALAPAAVVQRERRSSVANGPCSSRTSVAPSRSARSSSASVSRSSGAGRVPHEGQCQPRRRHRPRGTCR